MDVFAYIRTADGLLTAMHDVVASADGSYWIATFNPGSNRSQQSSLRLVNQGASAVRVWIEGVDDTGASPGTPVEMTVPGPGSATVTAAQLESGSAGVDGAIGDGIGKWRLRLTADGPLTIVNLLSSPTGHLTNLSPAPSS